jgi:hypothetical protein
MLYFNFSVVSSTALCEVWFSNSSFAKGINYALDRHHQHQELPDRMFKKVNSLNDVWRPLDCRDLDRHLQISSRFQHWCLNPIPGHTVQNI